ncbi:multiplied multi-transmembrane transporter-like protein [Babesia gibsoni]|uniref:Multiplied multi-transmembrane transporter-like protein n=1 Tax=Babesia gibsoni TaxID=33632 RepID=A0AAD8US63_BABGI|nr:multiplied multi-transmembrane transporter-like protein [Babesia gibsoni]
MSEKEKEYTYFAFALAMFVSFMDGFDMQILGTCMRPFEINLGLPPSKLSVITSAQFMSLLVVTPLWGRLVDKFECGYIQCVAVLLCGLACVLHGLTSSYPMIVILTIINSAGLACTAPVDQKIITAMWSEKNGVYFGISWSCYCVGRLISSSIGASLVMKNIAGQYGWRVYCFIAGYIWILSSVLIHLFMKKKTSTDNTPEKKKLPSLYKVATFWLLIPVKYSSNAPIVILSYMVMYFQNSGLSDNMAGFAVGIVQVGSGVGGTGGGWVADKIHELETGYARIGLAIAALVVRVLCIMLLLWSPIEGGSLRRYHYAQLLIIGLSLFTIQGVDKAMLGKVVSKDDQATAISLVYLMAGIPSSTTLPTFVGYMAERRFGYVVSTDKGVYVDPVAMLKNATALRKCMIYCMLIASTVNIVFYGGLMITYKSDAEKAKCPEGSNNSVKDTSTQNGVSSGTGEAASACSATNPAAQKAEADLQTGISGGNDNNSSNSELSNEASSQGSKDSPKESRTSNGNGDYISAETTTASAGTSEHCTDTASEAIQASSTRCYSNGKVGKAQDSNAPTADNLTPRDSGSGHSVPNRETSRSLPPSNSNTNDSEKDEHQEVADARHVSVERPTGKSHIDTPPNSVEPSVGSREGHESSNISKGNAFVSFEGFSASSKSGGSEGVAAYMSCIGATLSTSTRGSENVTKYIECVGLTGSSKTVSSGFSRVGANTNNTYVGCVGASKHAKSGDSESGFTSIDCIEETEYNQPHTRITAISPVGTNDSGDAVTPALPSTSSVTSESAPKNNNGETEHATPVNTDAGTGGYSQSGEQAGAKATPEKENGESQSQPSVTESKK